MSEIKLLDCTLRDGGYINDWNFGEYTIRDILSKLIESGVDYIEVGFLRDCAYDRTDPSTTIVPRLPAFCRKTAAIRSLPPCRCTISTALTSSSLTTGRR